MERTMQEKEELEMDHCEETEVHEELLRIVQEKLPKEEELYDLAELYKVFGGYQSGSQSLDDSGYGEHVEWVKTGRRKKQPFGCRTTMLLLYRDPVT